MKKRIIFAFAIAVALWLLLFLFACKPDDPHSETTTTTSDTTAIPEDTNSETEPPDADSTTAQSVLSKVKIYGGDMSFNEYSLEVGTLLDLSLLEHAFIPSDSENIRYEHLGWEYSTGGVERITLNSASPPTVGEDGLCIYPIIEKDYAITFMAGEGSFGSSHSLEFWVDADSTVSFLELSGDIPTKPSDERYKYSCVGFDYRNEQFSLADSFKAVVPMTLTARYESEEQIYTLKAYCEMGKLFGGGKYEVSRGNLDDMSALVDKYFARRPADIYFDDVAYIYQGAYIEKDELEWTLILFWLKKELTYTLTFEQMGREDIVSEIVVGTKAILPSPTGYEDAEYIYEFVGWRCPDGLLFEAGAEYLATADHVFKAEYRPLVRKVYKVTFTTSRGVFENGLTEITLSGYYNELLTPPEIFDGDGIQIGQVRFIFDSWDDSPIESFTENREYSAIFTTDRPIAYISYTVNGEPYTSLPYYIGDAVTPPPQPTHNDGWVFGGWLGLPELMPERDLLVDSSYKPVRVIYKLDGQIYSSSEVAVGSIVTVASPLVIEGHTTSGWSTTNIDSLEGGSFTMPPHDVVFEATSTPNPHRVIYILDQTTFYEDYVVYGQVYTVRGIEIKLGHSFSGWSISSGNAEIIGGVITVPDGDVVIVGSFEIRSYNVHYYIDDLLVYTDTYTYGETINLRPPELQEGCSFEWNTVELDVVDGVFTMPARTVNIYGAFSDGDKKLCYIIDGKEYAVVSYRAGTTVHLLALPEKKGYTFYGWSSSEVDIVNNTLTMPDGDLTVFGSFIPNMYKIYFVDLLGETALGVSEQEYGSTFFIGDSEYCLEGRVSVGWVLISGNATLTEEGYLMPDENVVFAAVWEDCLTLCYDGDTEYFPWYFSTGDIENDGYYYDAETGILYIYDERIKAYGHSDGVTVEYVIADSTPDE